MALINYYLGSPLLNQAAKKQMIVLMYLQKNQIMRIKITCRDLLSALNQTSLQKQRDFVLFGQEVFPRINIYIALVVLVIEVADVNV